MIFIRILFLPNFRVSRIPSDDSSILSSNKVVDDSAYWFFRHFPDAKVEVLDNATPFPLNLLRDLLKIEILQPFKALLRQREYDAVISHSFNAGCVFGILRSLLHIKNPPHFIIDVGSLNGGRDKPLEIALVRLALRSVSGLLYHSSVNEEFYSRHFPSVGREFVPFGVDPDFFRPLSSQPSNDFVLSIGSRKRDYSTLINAWRRIDFPLKVVGSEITDLGDLPNIQLVGSVPISELMRMIHNSRLIVLPLENVKYSVGQMTLLQCMSMRKAVVVTYAAGVKDYCSGNENCLTVSVRSESDIAEKVNLLLTDAARAERIASGARESILTRFNEKEMAMRIYGFISRTFSARNSVSRRESLKVSERHQQIQQ